MIAVTPLVDEFVEDLWYDEPSSDAEEPTPEGTEEPRRAEPVLSFL
ncbi:MAG: hypothetical protein ACRDT4_22795 [Micromonosporaceae bacterium]